MANLKTEKNYFVCVTFLNETLQLHIHVYVIQSMVFNY